MSSPDDFWAPLGARPATTIDPTAQLSAAGLPTQSRWRRDLVAAGAIIVACVLLGAPTGLLWSAVAPRLTVRLTASGPQVDNLESSKAFVGADGSFLIIVLLLGVLTGLLAWLFARRHGPWTVVALLLGGLLAAQIAATVGLRPGAMDVAAKLENPASRGTVELFLGKRDTTGTALRAPWAVVGWPVGALLVFFGLGLRRPEELD